jgi:uncharacterized protein DUF1844
MSGEEDKQESRGFKVEDRRRFSDTGDARTGVEDRPPQESAPSAAPAPPPHSPQAATAAGTAAGAASAHARPALELNFSTFLISLSTQALAQLGEIPNPIDNQTTVDLGAAKQLIDILAILREKTKGNLDKSESDLLDSALYDLRLRYVERARARS